MHGNLKWHSGFESDQARSGKRSDNTRTFVRRAIGHAVLGCGAANRPQIAIPDCAKQERFHLVRKGWAPRKCDYVALPQVFSVSGF
jgi:hypothetical protein